LEICFRNFAPASALLLQQSISLNFSPLRELSGANFRRAAVNPESLEPFSDVVADRTGEMPTYGFSPLHALQA